MSECRKKHRAECAPGRYYASAPQKCKTEVYRNAADKAEAKAGKG